MRDQEQAIIPSLQRSYGKGFSLASLFRMRQFYLAFPKGSGIQDKAGAIFSTPLRILAEATVSPTGSTRSTPSTPPPKVHFPSALAWSHYLVLLRIANDQQAIIDRLEAFLLELGKGFCFVGRQKRLTIDSDHFYVDLVFYNRLLQCFVLVDLKLGKLTHQDLGQMQMYVNYFDRTQRSEHETKTIGIVLCSEQNAAMVKITLPEDNEQIIAATYRQYLPTEAELRAELEREREEAERVLRLTAPLETEGDKA